MMQYIIDSLLVRLLTSWKIRLNWPLGTSELKLYNPSDIMIALRWETDFWRQRMTLVYSHSLHQGQFMVQCTLLHSSIRGL